MSASKGECLKSRFRLKRPDAEDYTGLLFIGLGFRCSINAGPSSATWTKYNDTPATKLNGRPIFQSEHLWTHMRIKNRVNSCQQLIPKWLLTDLTFGVFENQEMHIDFKYRFHPPCGSHWIYPHNFFLVFQRRKTSCLLWGLFVE